ncbi:39S ribosomal protein L37, mitochondrial [Dunckerocampus dactyliophorus]|uniref:39S ribosomal protein L37, mitochondrial n=1 Tax=Dunckerocampus dactyliophorus TaxID=161453 RepID=UPI0024052F0D|nr:39S ribosomal protein L37, mitochondrial [Dunckerocampus dactyliophorus]
MFSETVCMTPVALAFSKWVLCRHFSRLSACGERSGLQVRHFSVSHRIARKASSQREVKEKVHVPGLDMVTYGEKMHYVPWLAKPVYSQWEMDYKDPKYFKSPPKEEMPLFKEKPCYVFNQRTNALEGVRQALWLTKSKVISGLPPELLSTAVSPANQLPNQDSRVQNAIKHARFWDTTEARPDGVKYSNTLLFNLLHLCATLQSSHPLTRRRMLVEKCSLAASWKRGDNLFQIRGQNALVYNSMDPLPRVSGLQEVLATADHTLETFYPVSPTVDLQKVHVYKEEVNCTGFGDKYFYPHAHTLYFLEGDDVRCKLKPEQFRAKMIMFLFGSALAHACKLFGTKTQRVLDNPITIQAVGTNGRIFQYIVFQLNTTDLTRDDGIKNQVWLEEDAELYDFAKVRPLIVKKQVKVPAGLAGYKPETFSKFLALYLHGAV